MGSESTIVRCSDCGHIFADANASSSESHHPCPDCGSNARAISVQLDDGLSARDSLVYKERRRGKKHPLVEAKLAVVEVQRDTNRLSKRDMLVNNVENDYHERVTDLETGQVVHECHEPLSEHTGHGNARRRRSDEAQPVADPDKRLM